MKAAKSKINRAKGIEICADLLFTGKTRKEIVQIITDNYSACESSVDKWMKFARIIVQERNNDVELIKARELEAATVDLAKELNLTRKELLQEYKKIAFFDIRKCFTVDGGLKPIQDLDDNTAGAIAGIESFDEKTSEGDDVLGTLRKVKISDKRQALDSISRVLGYNAPAKLDLPPDLDLASLTITFK